MLFKKALTLYVLIALLIAGAFSIFFFWYFLNKKNPTPDSSYETLQQHYPSFESDFNKLTATGDFQTLALYSENLISGAKEGYETSYLTYAAAYSYTNAVVQNNDDNESLEKAILFSKKLITDNNQYPIFRAYALDSYDRLLFSFMKQTVKDRALSEPFLREFITSDQKDIRFVRKNLLERAIELYPVTNAHYKLAIIFAQDLYNSPLSNSQKATQEQSVSAFKHHMTEGEELLKRDYAGEGLFRNTKQIPETLLSRTLAAQIYYTKTGETPYGDISNLYDLALAESNQLNPTFTRHINYWQSLWKKQSD